MAQDTDDSLIRVQLRNDIKVAWNPKKIYDNPALAAANLSDLPRAYIFLDELSPVTAQGTASLSEVSIPHNYTLAIEDKYPSVGNLQALKVTKVGALVDRLVSKPRYMDLYVRSIDAIRMFDNVAPEDVNEYVYRFEIDFSLEVISAYFEKPPPLIVQEYKYI